MGLFSFLKKPLEFVGGLAGDLLGLGGDIYGTKEASDNAADQVQYQRDFAQQGVRWRVEDAKAAGINPLVAMGANLPTYQPSNFIPGDYGMSKFGQGLNRAIESMKTKDERQTDRDMTVERQWIENQKARKELGILSLEEKKLQRELLNQPGMPGVNAAGVIPGLPGQTGVNNVPADRIVSGTLGVQKGAQPMQQLTIDQKGRIFFPLGKAVEEAMENDPFVKYKYLGARFRDTFIAVGKGLVDKVYNLPHYDQAVLEKRNYIARELGIPKRFVQYNRYMDTYFVTPRGRKLINYNK